MSKQRLIDANALIQEINGYFRPIDESKPMTLTVGQIEEVLDIMQTIEAAPVVRGRWIRYLDGPRIIPDAYYRCSVCGDSFREFKSNFCPSCGADMRKE